MVNFIIIRHGCSVTNRDKKFTGSMDVPLTELGYDQAKRTAEYVFKNFNVDRIYSSDLSRAVDTAKPIADVFELPIITDEKLREIDVGYWQGKSHEEVKALYSESYNLYMTQTGHFHFDGGESFDQVKKRAVSVFEDIAKQNEGKTVVIVTHGGFIRALYCAWYDVKPQDTKYVSLVGNTSVSIAEYKDGKGEFSLLGSDAHLEDINFAVSSEI